MSLPIRSRFPLWPIVLTGIIAISFSAIFVRWSAAPVSVIAMYRLLLTACLMAPFAIRRMPAFRRLAAADWMWLLVSGLMLGLHFLLWMASLSHTTVASSTAILTLEPILVLIGSFLLFRIKLPPLALAGMAIAIGGAGLIGWGDFGLSAAALKGDLLSFLGTAAVAVHMLIGKYAVARVSAFVYSFTVFLSAGLVLALYNAAAGYSFTDYPAAEWGNFLLLALVPTLLGHYLFNWLLGRMPATSVSMTVLGEPIGAGLLAWLLLGESITALQAASGGLLLFGVWLFIRGRQHSVGSG